MTKPYALSALKEGRVGFAIVLDSEDLGFILIKGGSEPLIREWFGCLYSKLTIQHTAVQLTAILFLIGQA